MLSPPRPIAHDPAAQTNGVGRTSHGFRRRIWVTQAVSSQAVGTLHTVQTGETLAQIALAYGVPVEQIKEAAKGGRGRRATLRADVALKPGQELLVPRDGRAAGVTHVAATPPPGFPASLLPLSLAQTPPPLLAACLGGMLVTAGVARLLTAQEAGNARAPSAPGADASPSTAAASAAASAPHVSSAVAEVRSLLKDAAVEVHAVESALAAVRRATAAARAAPAAGSAVVVSAPAAAHADGATTTASSAAAAAAPEQVASTPAVLEMSAGAAPASTDAAPSVASAAAALEAAGTPAGPLGAASPPPTAQPADVAQAAAPAGGAATSADTPTSAATLWPDLSAFDTAAQVAAARLRVESALEAARGLLGLKPAPAAAAAAAGAAPATAGSAAQASEASSGGGQGSGEVVEAVEAAGRPLDAAAAGQVLERIRGINKLLEEEQQCAGAGGLRRAAVDVQAAEVLPAAAAAAPAEAAVDRERAAGLLLKVDRLLSSFDDLDLSLTGEEVEQAEAQPEQPTQPTASAASGVGSVASVDAELLPPPPPGGAPTPPPSPAAADSTTTTHLRLVLPTPAAPAVPVVASRLDAGAPASVAAALEAAVAPLAAAIPGPVLDRFRDIGRILEEEQRKTEQPATAESAPSQTSADLTADSGAAAPAAAPVPGSGAGGVPPRIVGSLNRAFNAPPASPRDSLADSPSTSPSPSSSPRSQPQPQANEPPPQRPRREPLGAPAPPPLPTSLQLASEATLPPLQPQLAAGSIGASSSSGGGGAQLSARADATLVNLKSGLLDLVYGTSRGVNATALQRAAIEEFVTALEARNPNTAPTDAVSALVGRWKLVYTSNLASLMLLGALDGMPLVEAGDVVQIIHPDSLTATNKIDLCVPLLVSLRAEAGLEVRSPRRFRVRLSRLGLDTYVATPQLTAALEVPPSVRLMGASLDLAPLRGLVGQINAGVQGLLSRAASPEVDLTSLPLPPGVPAGAVSDAASLWMLTTYLDDSLRISRDDEGRVFIMMKDVGIPH